MFSSSVRFLEQGYTQEVLREEIVKTKNMHARRFNHLVDNFHVLRSAIRYYVVKKGSSFTASTLSEDFPVPVTVAGSSLKALDELGVVEPRTRSSSPDRYLPREVDMEKLEQVRVILLRNHEIREF